MRILQYSLMIITVYLVKTFNGLHIRTGSLQVLNKLRQMSSSSSRNNKVIVLAGATSVGKSAVSLELCKHLNAEIVIADSVQVYKGLDIGANKPTVAEQQIVPHHLIDISLPSEQMSTGDFSSKASEVINDILRRNKVPIVVGGSTMWIQWLVHGKPDAPKASEEALRRTNELINELEEQKKWDDAFDILKLHDPTRASKLPRNDWYRLRRYLEIAIDLSTIGSSKESDSDNEVEKVSLTGARTQYLEYLDVRCFFLTESRQSLYHTIDRRCEQMLNAGLLDEVTSLLLDGSLAPEFPISKSIGYRQNIDYLAKENWSENDVKSFGQFLR